MGLGRVIKVKPSEVILRSDSRAAALPTQPTRSLEHGTTAHEQIIGLLSADSQPATALEVERARYTILVTNKLLEPEHLFYRRLPSKALE